MQGNPLVRTAQPTQTVPSRFTPSTTSMILVWRGIRIAPDPIGSERIPGNKQQSPTDSWYPLGNARPLYLMHFAYTADRSIEHTLQITLKPSRPYISGYPSCSPLQRYVEEWIQRACSTAIVLLLPHYSSNKLTELIDPYSG